MKDHTLRQITTEDFAAAVASDQPLVILLPVGSVEPHGPHLTLLTDTIISEESARLAAQRLAGQGVTAWIAPSVPFGVTECAAGFKGAVSVPAEVLSRFLASVVRGFLDTGAGHVCLVNNHLEPDHYQAVLDAAQGFGPGECSVACPLAKRWARTLSDEFKRGECHAGRYETSLVLGAAPEGVKREVQGQLPEVAVSLSDALKAGKKRFTEMGLSSAYAGAPAQASAAEGRELLGKLATMIVTEVREGLAAAGRA